MKKTKIICTLGPASEKVNTLKKMIRAGMNAARLNFSHGTYGNFDLLINNIRQAQIQYKANIALIQDLQGPKIRVGVLPKDGILLKQNQLIHLTTSLKLHSIISHPENLFIPIQYHKLPKEVKSEDLILMDDGLIEVKVLSTNHRDTITAKVIHGGILKSHKGINVPSAALSANCLTPKDKKDLIFGLKYSFDYIALSFVRNQDDLKTLKKLLRKYHSNAGIIAKIERPEAIQNLEEIIKESDALMVARGDLGVEIGAEKVPIIQKEIVRLANIHGKPVIIATQMLQSMITNPRASRAEISDAATAIFDHADAFMLSNETSVGKYPVEATETLASVAKETEKELNKKQYLLRSNISTREISLIEGTCGNACDMAREIKAKYIIVITKFGNTALELIKHRPLTPIITITPNKHLISKLAIMWGLNKIFLEPSFKFDTEMLSLKVPELLIEKKLAKTGDEIVIVSIQDKHHIIQSLVL